MKMQKNLEDTKIKDYFKEVRNLKENKYDTIIYMIQK